MNTPSYTVKTAQQLLAEREVVGLAKYGTTVDRTDLTKEQWLQHLIEELADGLLYALRARDEIRAAADPERAKQTPPENLPTALDDLLDPDDLVSAIAAKPGGNEEIDKARAWVLETFCPERAAYLRRWEGAPADATHLSQSYSNRCNWWRADEDGGPPVLTDGLWIEWSGCEWISDAGTDLLGRLACESRPDVQP
jgi:hypothetical protein